MVVTCLERARDAGLSWPLPDDLEEDASEGTTVDELMTNMKEAIELCLAGPVS